MREKILLIDGHSILNRAFYGLPDLTNAEGLHTNAIYGFLNILFKMVEEEKPDYLTVAFDLAAPTFRHKMYDAYKGTRKPMPHELRQQVPVMKDVLTAWESPFFPRRDTRQIRPFRDHCQTQRGKRYGRYRAFRRPGSASAQSHRSYLHPDSQNKGRKNRLKIILQRT